VWRERGGGLYSHRSLALARAEESHLPPPCSALPLGREEGNQQTFKDWQ
jgi:hypothetical protein